MPGKGAVMKTFAEQRIAHIGEAVDSLMTLDIHIRGVVRPVYEVMRRKVGEPLSTHAARGLLAAVSPPEAVVLVGTGFLIRPTLNPETDGPIGAVMLARALAILDRIPVIAAEAECMPALRVACRAAELSVVPGVAEAKATPRSVVLTSMPRAGDAAGVRATLDFLLSLRPAAMVSIEHPGKAEDGAYYSALGYALDGWLAPVDDLLELVRERGGFTIGIGDMGNEAGMGYAAPEIETLIPYGSTVVAKGSCAAPIMASVSNFGAYGLIAAMEAISGKRLLHSPEMEETVLRAAVMAGAICGCTGIPQASVDMVDVTYARALVHLLHGVLEYARKFPETRPYFIDYYRGAELGAPGTYKGGHGR